MSPSFPCQSLGRYSTPVLGLALLLIAGCSGPTSLQRGTVSEEPVIDGALDEWGRSLDYVDDRPVSMSVRPTDSLLYVAISIQEQPLVRSVVEKGLIVWVDPTDSQEQTYGIRYPLGLRMQRAERTRGEASESGPSVADLEDLFLSELEVLRGDARARIPAQFSSGLRAKMTLGQGSLVYELAVPVNEPASPDAHGLRAPLSGSVGVGLQTPSEDDETVSVAPAPPSAGTPSGRGRPPRGGQRGGRRGRRGGQQPPPPPSTPDRPELDLWTTIEVSGN